MTDERDYGIAGVKKKPRFATLTNYEFATLNTLLQERESINTRRATDMAARTFQSYINDEALYLNLCITEATFVVVI